MNPNETESLIQKLLDMEISEAEFVRLEKELSRNSEARSAFRDYSYIHSAMDVPEEFKSGLRSKRLVKRKRKFSVAGGLAIAAGVVLMVTLGLHSLKTGEVAERDLVFQVSAYSRYVITAPDPDSLTEESILPVGATFSITQGTVQLDFAKGVRSIINAPASFTLASVNKLDLHEGKAWFEVPESGQGFQVETAGMLLTDYGTEFGVINIPGSTDEVHVFKGSVNAAAMRGAKSEELLLSGDALMVNGAGELVQAPELNSPFATSLSELLPHLYLSFDEVQNDRTLIAGEHPALSGLVARMVQSDGRPASSRLVEGRFGQAVEFDGQGDLVETNWAGVYGPNPLTISFWLKPSPRPNFAGIVSWGLPKPLSAENNQWKVVLRPGKKDGKIPRHFKVAWGQNAHMDVPAELTPEEWNHFVVVYSGSHDGEPGELTFYMNGKARKFEKRKLSEPPRRPADLAETKPMTFGHPVDWKPGERAFVSNCLKGVLDEFYMIEGELTEEQIQTLYRENVYRP